MVSIKESCDVHSISAFFLGFLVAVCLGIVWFSNAPIVKDVGEDAQQHVDKLAILMKNNKFRNTTTKNETKETIKSSEISIDIEQGKGGSIWAPERAVCNGSHTHQGYPETLQQFQASPEGLRLHTESPDIYKDFIEFAKKKADDGLVVFTVVTIAYKQALMNWLHAAVSSGVRCLVVITVEKEMHAYLASLGFDSFEGESIISHAADSFGLKWPVERLKSIWALRFLLLRALLAHGVSVLQCDADAILLRNPLPLLKSLKGDVVAQRGTFPFRINLSWGATMCFGTILYRPTIATLGWFDMVLPRFYKEGDDQSEFQRALDACTLVVWNHGYTWPSTRDEHRSLKPQSISNKTDYGATLHPITTGGERLHITMLPTNLFPRKCGPSVGSPEKTNTVIIAHCISSKGSGVQKLKSNDKYNISFLRDSWEETPPNKGENIFNYLIRIGDGTHPGQNK
eukprot:m.38384 g.38384  ORF g.38384 m.38384 type:complete len:456 (+) comp9428_c0_seq1:176-1543(+)